MGKPTFLLNPESLSKSKFDDGVHCCAVLEDAPGRGKKRCQNTGKYTYEGRLYCGIHNPPFVKERYAKKQAKKIARSKGIPPLNNTQPQG